ncbi:OmpA family protein [Emticicia sp. BO119]|uniref:OmpA family protein n=1 Tax=Emticicia sp. BO119 TaxID=2757768 RepID=UPI0015EFF2C8|nr:OmpA family protein [Emticicia sp. BO119]MBA4849850.1 OmpA family protein [Emticicia sp. BO119]
MNRFLILLLILLWSLAYSWFWNCHRKPYCYSGTEASLDHNLNTDSIASPAVDSAQMTAEEQILFKPLDVYFVSGQAGILHTPEVDTFLVTAKKYLNRNSEKQLLITGHTDSDGAEDSNQKLSEIRAGKVKDLLAKEGIRAGQMAIEGKGEKEPIASNTTDEGKAKNRRATIRLKN